MQRNIHASRRAGTPLAAGLVGLLIVLTTAAPAAAQNNDDVGVLPGVQQVGTGTESTVAPMLGSEFGGLLLAEEPAAVEMHPGQSTIEIEAGAVAVQAGSAEADVQPMDGQPLAGSFEPEAGRLSLQSKVTLDLHPGLDMRLVAATEYQHRLSVIVLETGGSLDLLLSGAVAPLIVDVRGDVPALDLRTFKQAVEHHGQQHPGLFVTWVNGTIDAYGQLHLLAVRASTDGGPLEIGTR